MEEVVITIKCICGGTVEVQLFVGYGQGKCDCGKTWFVEYIDLAAMVAHMKE